MLFVENRCLLFVISCVLVSFFSVVVLYGFGTMRLLFASVLCVTRFVGSMCLH